MNWLLRRMTTLLAAVLCLALIAGPATAAPFTVRIPIISDLDDVEEDIDANDSDIDTSSSDLELGNEGAPDLNLIGLRFRDIPIAPGMQILNAGVQFAVDETDNTSDLSVKIFGELPSLGTSPLVLSNRPRTTNSVVWADIPIWTVVHEQGPDQLTPDLSAIIQEIIDSPGWAEGDALNILIFPEPFGVPGVPDSMGERTAESWDGAVNDHSDPSLAPTLVITYVPEPATLALLAVGLLGLRRRNRA